MSGIGVAKGESVSEIKKPEACEKCQRRQCDLTCPSLAKYTKWRQKQIK